MNKTASIIIIGALIISIGLIFRGPGNRSTLENIPNENIELRDGIQYITITARAGYSPKVSTVTAGIPTKLIMKTNGTYDCSSSLVIPSLGYRKILPRTGEEIIDLGTPAAGSSLQGVCGMGMYNFLINFSE